MVSFTEQATLALVDKSSKEIRTINNALRDLFKTANKMQSMRIDFRGLDRADQQVRRLSRDMRALHSKPVKLNVTANTTQAQAAINRLARNRTMNVTPNVTGGTGPFGTGRGNSRGFGNRFGVGAGFGGMGFGVSSGSLLQTILAGTGFAATRSAGRAVLARSSEETTQRVLGWTEKQMVELGEAAKRASAGQLNVTETQALAATRNLANAGASGKALDMLAKTASQAEAALTQQFGAEEARRITEQAIKGIDLAGAIDDPTRGDALLKAIVAAQVVQGQDFNLNSFLAAMRTTTATVSMTAAAMTDFAMMVDEQGQRAGSSLERFNKVLTAEDRPGSGVAKGTIDALERSGLRADARQNRKLLESDPFEFIDRFVVPKLEALGIALDDAAGIKKGLQDLGLVGQDLRFAQQAVVKKDERARNRARNKQVQFDKFRELAQKDIGLAMQSVAAQFNDLSVSVLKPFADSLAPRVLDVADGLDQLARGTFTAKGIKAALTAGVAGLGVLAAQHPGAVALTLAGGRLTGSAGALSRAAAALQRAAVADGATPGGVVGGGKGNRGIVGRFGRGVAGAGAGAVVMGGLELASGGSVDDVAGSMAGAFVGGVVGSLGGPAGTMIGSFIGSEIGRTYGSTVTSLLKPMLDQLEKAKNDPLVKTIADEGHKFFDQVRRNQQDRDINITERKRREAMAEIQKTRAKQTFTAEAIRINTEKAFFGEETTKGGTTPVPTPKPNRGILDELIKSRPIKLEISTDDAVNQMIKVMRLEKLDRQDTLMRQKDEGLQPTAGNTFNLMLQGMDQFNTTFGASAEQASMSFEATFANGAVALGTAGTNIGSAIGSAGDTAAGKLAAAGSAFGANAAAAFNANARAIVAAPQPAAPNTGRTDISVE